MKSHSNILLGLMRPFRTKLVFIYFILLAILVQCVSSGGVAPTYSAMSYLATGKVTPQNGLLDPSTEYKQFTVAFDGNVLNTSRSNVQSIVSLISFECYTSYEFSLNTSVSSTSNTSMTF